ncbi:diguanylate phosphodiesterase [Salinisphaera orenii MK-B5]|uniref:Diguanylate phosphodiesterase n=1 Tax=Salinisphaera orenii MK-B5 TaxID=856730 RepID=A0A423PTD8_9GAMM|nr:EAL domain-containing protein [Salinisphaera orenii]ROO28880.1 diguanylate phosphodiesterase [Salinisphaera orenii MK-B5]
MSYEYRNDANARGGQQPAVDAGLMQLMRSAAYSIEAPTAVLYRLQDDWLSPTVRIGAQAAASGVKRPAAWAEPSAPGVDRALLIANDTERQTDWAVPEIADGSGSRPRFAVFVPVRDHVRRLLGALLITDSRARAGLSAAQTYVLETHGVQIARQLTAPDGGAGVAEPPLPGPYGERLRLLESVVVNANDAVLITEAEPIDRPGPRIVYCNAAFTRTTGYAEADVLGDTPRILQGADTDRAALDRLRAALEHWRPIEIELRNYRRDGAPFWVELSIVPVADEHGWFTHWVSVQRDVSERKQAEAVANQARIVHAEKIALQAKLAERQRMEESLKYAASHDDLTGLRNRANVMDSLESLLSGNDAGGPAASGYVLFMDLDRFKLVNDSLGHRSGDLLLMEMARRLECCVGDADTLARVGGDEFVIVQRSAVDESDAVALAERVLERLRAPFRIQGQDLFTSASIGLVAIGRGHDTPEALLRDADIAMYAAKFKGHGQYSLYTDSMRSEVIETLALQNDIRQALAEDQFTLHYQPIYDPTTGRFDEVEALARWCHPQRGDVPPAVFMSIAEEIGVVVELGGRLLELACAQVAAWNAQLDNRELGVSVNVSVSQLRHHGFLDRLASILSVTGLPARLLQLEITETLFLQNDGRVAELLMRLRARGVRVALDDFGTGYSALAYIDQYEIDTIKIDRSFVLRMLRYDRTLAIVRAIIDLGRTLSLQITAEGIETEDQLARIRELGCPRAQGFLLARPMPPERLAELLSID